MIPHPLLRGRARAGLIRAWKLEVKRNLSFWRRVG
jgi:hypothetical protein